MITEEEKQEIVNAAVEKTLLMLPEVIGNLIMNQLSIMKANKDFYGKYKEFVNHKDVVALAVESVESENLGMDYTKLLEKAVPVIRERLKTANSLSMNRVEGPIDRAITNKMINDNGEL